MSYRHSVLLAAVLTAVVMTPRGTADEAYASSGGEEFLYSLQRVYGSIESVHLVASATVRLIRRDSTGEEVVDREGEGTFEYWADGERYRARCRTDRSLALTGDVDIAFDGEKFQFYDHSSNTLSIQKADVLQLPAALPNPLFLPVDFLTRDDDDCRTCSLRLRDLMDVDLWSARLRDATPVTKGRERGVSLAKEFSKLQTSFRYRIWAGEGGTGRLERVSASGAVLVAVEFALPEGGGLPRHLSVRGFDPEDPDRVMTMDYVLVNLEVNEPMSRSVFQVPARDAAIWDSDRRSFLNGPNRPATQTPPPR